MCVVTTAARAAALGSTPLVRLAAWAVSGVAQERIRDLAGASRRRYRGTHPGHTGPQGGAPRRAVGLETMCIGGGQGIAAVLNGCNQQYRSDFENASISVQCFRPRIRSYNCLDACGSIRRTVVHQMR